MADIEFTEVTKRYPDGTEAVSAMNLAIEDGEFMILVGPSGCGKTTALRMLAGLEDITDGTLRIGARVVNDLSAKDRDVAMVFQNYALYPHMTVRANMGFALRLRGEKRDAINARVEQAARVLGLTEQLDRKPANLSGGQRQRVAMGRAIVREPQAFLMDEPLSNLDAKLRVQMRAEVGRLQDRLGITTVYVTHDQTEAMTLGDRVAVMRGGLLQQVAAPRELYAGPANVFVAGFLGSPAMNFFDGELSDGAVKTPLGALPLGDRLRRHLEDVARPDERRVIVGLRPEAFEDPAAASGGGAGGGAAREQDHVFDARIELVESLGSELYVHFDHGRAETPTAILAHLTDDATDQPAPLAVARVDAGSALSAGRVGSLCVDTTKLHLFAADDGRALAPPVAQAAAATIPSGSSRATSATPL